jgi:hypothetical protein
MPHLGISWQLAAILASGLLAVAGLAWLPHRRPLDLVVPFVREGGLIVGLWRRDLAPPESSPDKLGVSVNVRSTGVR